MRSPLEKISFPALSRIILVFGRHSGKIFSAGLALFVLAGAVLFYFFGYNFSQQEYVSETHLQGVNRGLLTATLKQLQDQQSKAVNPPPKNPFE